MLSAINPGVLMALSLKKIRERAQRLLMLNKRQLLEPRDDIQRENLEEDSAKKSSYTLNSVIGDIKRNWVDIKKLNKKY